MEVEVQNVSSARSIPSDEELGNWVRLAFGGEQRGSLTVRIVDEPESAELNQRYRQVQGATNVLAFPVGAAVLPDMEDLPPLGDIVICAPVLEREARDQGKTLQCHWAHIAVHGSLHLQGFDHDNDVDAQQMESRETELLKTLGFGDPYAGDD
jgi:probable rRNA maturation factor